MKILITGSEGTVGEVVKRALPEHQLVLIDKKFGIDILKEDISNYFTGVDLTIHLAAHPKPSIVAEEAEENVLMMWKVLEACRKKDVSRIIFSSSIHVYDFNKLYEEGNKITEETPLKVNAKIWEGEEGRGMYSTSKIICEKLLQSYYEGFGIRYLALRLGGVNPENKPYTNYPFDFSTWLSHEDLTGIIRKAVNYNFEKNAGFVCVSDNLEKFIDLSLLERTLHYIPQSKEIKQ